MKSIVLMITLLMSVDASARVVNLPNGKSIRTEDGGPVNAVRQAGDPIGSKTVQVPMNSQKCNPPSILSCHFPNGTVIPCRGCLQHEAEFHNASTHFN